MENVFVDNFETQYKISLYMNEMQKKIKKLIKMALILAKKIANLNFHLKKDVKTSNSIQASFLTIKQM